MYRVFVFPVCLHFCVSESDGGDWGEALTSRWRRGWRGRGGGHVSPEAANNDKRRNWGDHLIIAEYWLVLTATSKYQTNWNPNGHHQVRKRSLDLRTNQRKQSCFPLLQMAAGAGSSWLPPFWQIWWIFDTKYLQCLEHFDGSSWLPLFGKYSEYLT